MLRIVVFTFQLAICLVLLTLKVCPVDELRRNVLIDRKLSHSLALSVEGIRGPLPPPPPPPQTQREESEGETGCQHTQHIAGHTRGYD